MVLKMTCSKKNQWLLVCIYYDWMTYPETVFLDNFSIKVFGLFFGGTCTLFYLS